MVKCIWLSNEIFKWNAYFQGGTITPKNKWKRAYDIWERASDLIEKNGTTFDLCDGIANLKRSLNHRLNLIEEMYNLNKISYPNKPGRKRYLELLETYGIVRPFIMRNLIDIRNDIEHHDVNPPELARCKELVDVVWYFLKSTDAIVESQKNSILFQEFDEIGNETPYSVEVFLDYSTNDACKLDGWLPEEMISYKQKDNYFKVDIIDFKGKENCKDINLHMDKLKTDKWINGTVTSNRNVEYKNLVQIALSCF